jgi:hypothetical protein
MLESLDTASDCSALHIEYILKCTELQKQVEIGINRQEITIDRILELNKNFIQRKRY